MHNLMMNLPVLGTLGVAALLVGPLANLPIVAGAWVLDRCVYAGARVFWRLAHDGRNDRGRSRSVPSLLPYCGEDRFKPVRTGPHHAGRTRPHFRLERV
jgi:hypothetical protein